MLTGARLVLPQRSFNIGARVCQHLHAAHAVRW